MREDHFTRTPDAAAAYARAHAETMDRDVPSPGELAEMAADDRATRHEMTEPMIVHGDLVMDGIYLPPGVHLLATTGTAAGDYPAVKIDGAPEAFIKRVAQWAESRRDYDVLVRDDVVFLRRNGQPHPLHDPPL